MVKLAVRSIPTSGTPAELLSAAGIDAEHIAQAVRGVPVRAAPRRDKEKTMRIGIAVDHGGFELKKP